MIEVRPVLINRMRREYDFSRGKRGAVIPSSGKTRVFLMLDSDLIETFRAKAEAAGRGYQTVINEALRASLWEDDNRPPTVQGRARMPAGGAGSKRWGRAAREIRQDGTKK